MRALDLLEAIDALGKAPMPLARKKKVKEAKETPAWLAKSGKSFEGPNGNTVLGYEHRYKIEYAEIRGGEDTAMKKMSDWDRAEKCKSCGRNIVHLFWVQDKETKEIQPYGGDHLHGALGYPKELSKDRIEKIRNSVKNKEEVDSKAKELDDKMNDRADDSRGKAFAKYIKMGGYSVDRSYFNLHVFKKGDKFAVYPIKIGDNSKIPDFEHEGWKNQGHFDAHGFVEA